MHVLSAVLAPAIVAGICWLASWGATRTRGNPALGYPGGPPAFAVGYVVAHVVLIAAPQWPPVSARDWTFWIAVALMTISLFEQLWAKRTPVALAVVFSILAASAWFVLGALHGREWSAVLSVVWTLTLALASTFTWWALNRTSLRTPGAFFPIELWFICSVASAALVLSATALLGQLMGALAAVLGAAAVLGFFLKEISLGHGGITVLVVLFSSLLWQGVFYAEMPLMSAIALLAAMSSAGAGAIIKDRPGSVNRRKLIQVTLVIVFLAIGIAVSLIQFLAESGAEDYY